jgi:hypothetical protein
MCPAIVAVIALRPAAVKGSRMSTQHLSMTTGNAPDAERNAVVPRAPTAITEHPCAPTVPVVAALCATVYRLFLSTRG